MENKFQLNVNLMLLQIFFFFSLNFALIKVLITPEFPFGTLQEKSS